MNWLDWLMVFGWACIGASTGYFIVGLIHWILRDE